MHRSLTVSKNLLLKPGEGNQSKQREREIEKEAGRQVKEREKKSSKAEAASSATTSQYLVSGTSFSLSHMHFIHKSAVVEKGFKCARISSVCLYIKYILPVNHITSLPHLQNAQPFTGAYTSVCVLMYMCNV